MFTFMLINFLGITISMFVILAIIYESIMRCLGRRLDENNRPTNIYHGMGFFLTCMSIISSGIIMWLYCS